MAEFSEVMKQLARMTNACNGKCDECPLDSAALCAGPWCFENAEGIAEAERIIMQWAAEHPEPAYPSWYRWLIMMGAVSSVEDLFSDLQRPIPADVAEKLGIEPKEE